MKWLVGLLLLNFGFLLNSSAVPPVLNYAGQVTVNGEAFDGAGFSNSPSSMPMARPPIGAMTEQADGSEPSGIG